MNSKTKTPKLPIYTGPEVYYGDHAKAIKTAGPAPDGWRYLKVGEKIPRGRVIYLYDKEWNDGSHAVGGEIHDGDMPWAVPRELEYVGSKTDFLRLRVTERNSKKVTFVIDSQKGRDFPTFKASNRVEIDSMGHPEVSNGGVPNLFVRGADETRDNAELTATVSQFAKVAAAVREFNLSKAKPTKPKVDPNARIRELEAEVASLKAFKEGVEALLKG